MAVGPDALNSKRSSDTPVLATVVGAKLLVVELRREEFKEEEDLDPPLESCCCCCARGGEMEMEGATCFFSRHSGDSTSVHTCRVTCCTMLSPAHTREEGSSSQVTQVQIDTRAYRHPLPSAVVSTAFQRSCRRIPSLSSATSKRLSLVPLAFSVLYT